MALFYYAEPAWKHLRSLSSFSRLRFYFSNETDFAGKHRTRQMSSNYGDDIRFLCRLSYKKMLFFKDGISVTAERNCITEP